MRVAKGGEWSISASCVHRHLLGLVGYSTRHLQSQWVRFHEHTLKCCIRLLRQTATQTSGDVITDVVATGIPGTVAHPNSDLSSTANHGLQSRHLSTSSDDVEAIGEKTAAAVALEQYPAPTEDETRLLRKVADRIPTKAYLLCVVEFAERASYYGVKTVFSNFMQFPLPEGGNGAGAPPKGTELTAGALGRGIQFSVAIGLLFT